ncbi:citrate transporter [Tetragenococcus koreensis]|uniref:citrate transporter n=1 Tax=Tetragenococcus koreensis TaxID=290335 RepID=UPI001F1FDBEF|nr:citrate transporter [Tetragenococcus koreensis]MDN6264463.1 citrate transporter [Tetragenococcus halophilus]MCF1617973.1 citrate transporter [Tetragenococcus koreensis]MCF1622818.1 citrate transporter [Tetragenococcus koreensis]MCF1627836.1 citrate transporter [Tetragenococcus koreensis]MCF1678821.1 citrate transporter [Tetragenococcus koreensis]
MALLSIVPLIVVLVLLFMKVDMVIAGLVGGVIAMIIGGIGLAEANEQLLEAIPTMLGITVPIINSAIAMAVFKSGGYSAALTLAKRGTKGRVEWVAVFIVILLAAATYMSGIGGGSAMVIAPLAFAAVGVVPELIAAMSLAAAVSFTTSPASLESSIVSQLGEFEVADYVSTMRPYWLLFVVIAMVLAFWGTKRRNIGFKEEENDEYAEMSNGKLWKFTFPAIFLLFSVILGPLVNDLIGFEIFTPIVYMIVTLFLIYLCTDFSLNKSVDAMVDGSTYILTRLFQVGIFLAFINVIAQTGTFSVIAGLANTAPNAVVVPVAVLTGILIGVPAGAYVGSVLTLVLPVAVSLGFSPIALGFVTMGVGMGSQMSFVNITMQALSSGFQLPILEIVKGNVKWISMASVLLLIISFIFA